jgi:hypothetical protein
LVVVNTVTNVWVPPKAGYSFTCWGPTIFSRRILLLGVDIKCWVLSRTHEHCKPLMWKMRAVIRSEKQWPKHSFLWSTNR